MNVKICGISSYEDAKLALDLGAWAIGLNFYPPSPRYLRPEEAAALVKRLPAGALVFGVFVDAPLDGVNAIVETVGLGGVQLHGNETPGYARRVRAAEAMKVFRVGPGFDPSRLDAFGGLRILLDAYDPSRPGGTGKTFDWSVARAAAKRAPIVLAGGITPENVEAAIAAASPWGIDVASGVESRPGWKDPEKLRRLFEAVERSAKARGPTGAQRGSP